MIRPRTRLQVQVPLVDASRSRTAPPEALPPPPHARSAQRKGEPGPRPPSKKAASSRDSTDVGGVNGVDGKWKGGPHCPPDSVHKDAYGAPAREAPYPATV